MPANHQKCNANYNKPMNIIDKTCTNKIHVVID
jgi:hypothetical protein